MPKSASLAADPTDERPREQLKVIHRTVEDPAAELGMIVTELEDAIMVDRFKLTPTGIDIPADITPDEWTKLGLLFYRVKNSLKWWMGDWINKHRTEWGEMFVEARKLTRLSYGTLRNIASVAKAIKLSRRRDNLSWSHHVEVAGLSTELQDHWLDRAIKEKLSVHKLRGLITLSLGTGHATVIERRRSTRVRFHKFNVAVETVIVKGEGISAKYYSDMIEDLRSVIADIEKGVAQ